MSCRYCTYFEIWKGDGYCNYWRQHTDGSDTCQKDTSDRGRGHTEDDDYSSSTCYITTVVCSELGFNDNCKLLTTLRNFREGTLKAESKYRGILVEYDRVGPKISKAISRDSDAPNIAEKIYRTFLLPIENLICAGKKQEAIVKYAEMVLQLKARYNITS